jgi:PGF-pre-PGF domain-containing protein
MNHIPIVRTKNQIKISYIVSGFSFILLLIGTIIPVSAAGIAASREISAGKVNAGETFTVIVYIKADQHVEALTLRENLPDGWELSRVGDDGVMFQNTSTFKQTTREWIWVNNVSKSEEKTIVYNVTVPLNSKLGVFKISGAVSGYSISATTVGGKSDIRVISPLIDADFSASPLSGTAPLSAHFMDLSSNSTKSWEWDFDGDGIVDSKDRNPVHTYENPGNYTVSLMASNGTSENDTETKTGYITVTKAASNSGNDGSSGGSSGSSGGSSGGSLGGSGGSSGGGGGGSASPEFIGNIEFKEISNEQIFKGIHVCYTFKGEANDIVSLEFDPKKSFGKTTAIVEILKNTSSIVKKPAPGFVYKNINIWVGNSGFSSPDNLENATITFRLKKTWISEQSIDRSKVTLYRYSQNMWNPLSTVLKGENGDYVYFIAETPAFSPFAISSTEKISNPTTEKLQAEYEKSLTLNNSSLPEEKKENPNSDNKSEKQTSLPGLGFTFAAVNLLVSYIVLRRIR